MIQFEDLDLIAVVEGKPYKIVIDGDFYNFGDCPKCALNELPACDKYACLSSQHDLSFHYEEIPK